MTDQSENTSGDDAATWVVRNGLPTDLVEPGLEDPTPSGDLVDRIHASVTADRAVILSEAERADAPGPLTDAALAAWTVPESSADFVDRVVETLARDRAADPWREALHSFDVPAIAPDFVERTAAVVETDRVERTARWRTVLSKYRVPMASGDFVERTMSALRADEPTVLGGASWFGGWRAAAVAVAVVVLVAGYVAFGGPPVDPPRSDAPVRQAGLPAGAQAGDRTREGSAPSVPDGGGAERADGSERVQDDFVDPNVALILAELRNDRSGSAPSQVSALRHAVHVDRGVQDATLPTIDPVLEYALAEER